MTAEPFRPNALLERLSGAGIRFVVVGGLAELLRGLATNLGPVDILQGHPQIPAFADLDAQATDLEIAGIRIRVCSLEHLREMKRASERPRDRDDLEALEAAREGEDRQD